MKKRSFVRKIVMSGLVAAVAVFGCAGSAFAGTVTSAANNKTTPAFPWSATAGNAASRIAASYLARLSSARRLDASGAGLVVIGGASAVSCASPTACLSVGFSLSHTANAAPTPAAERLHAGIWKPVPVKTPTGAQFTLLAGVSCKAATYCLVVGDSVGNSNALGISPYALTWDGTKLTPIAAPPVPKSDEMGIISAVSCVAVRNCVAIGTGFNTVTGDTDQLVWTFNGTKWALTTVPGTDPNTMTEYQGLHCLSATSCVVIGDLTNTTGNASTDTPVAATWNGTTFTDLKAPLPAGVSYPSFTGLSCVSSRSCAMVGTGNTSTTSPDSLGFAEVWNGKTWTITKWSGPKGDTQAALSGVSCTSAARCIAAGAQGTDKAAAPAALAWNGSKWTVLKVPGPGSGKAAFFEGISCPVNGRCVTTGEEGKVNGSTFTPIAGYWNGSVWKYGPM
jgi:hypothetical protein